MALRTLHPQDLLGKTIRHVDTSAVNTTRLDFTDGTSLQLWSETVVLNVQGTISGILVDDKQLDVSRPVVEDLTDPPDTVFTLTFKTPGALDELEDNSNEGTSGADQALELANKYVEYGEYLRVDFDTATGKVEVQPVRNR